MAKPKIQVILGSIREGRNGEKMAKWFMESVKDTDIADLELVDLKDYALPLFADAGYPSMREVGKHEIPEVQRWLEKLMEADGYIIITAEYNHSMPGALKNALDYPAKEVHGKPVGFMSYGGFSAGTRAVEHLRQVVAELRMHDVRDQLAISMIWSGFDENGKMKTGEMLTKNAHTVVDAVADLALKLKTT